MYWLVMPNYFRDSHGYIKEEELNNLSILSWTDLSITIAIGGLLMAVFWRLFKTNSIAPSNDPDYKKSISKEES